MRLEDDRPIATTKAARRALARVVLAQGERHGLVAFGAADDHLHAEVVTDRRSAGDFARYVACALRWQLGLGSRFERARIRPLQDQRHAYNTFHYTHRQDSRHELALDLHREATSLPDMLGLRVLGTSLIARVRAHLPRVSRKDLLAHLAAGTFNDTAAIDLDVLPDAAAAALALADLDVRSVDATRARRAAIHAVGPDVPSTVLAECLGVCVRAVQASRRYPADPPLVRAVRLQAVLRTRAKSASPRA